MSIFCNAISSPRDTYTEVAWRENCVPNTGREILAPPWAIFPSLSRISCHYPPLYASLCLSTCIAGGSSWQQQWHDTWKFIIDVGELNPYCLNYSTMKSVIHVLHVYLVL